MHRIFTAIIIAVLCISCTAVSENTPTEQRTLRVCSYNIHHGQGMDGKLDLERIAAVIAKAEPDVVALQEVDQNCTRTGGRDLAKELGELLGMQHRFGKAMDFQGGGYGVAVLSKLPIVGQVRHVLPKGDEPRCALEVKVRFEGWDAPLSFVSVHNSWRREDVRVRQVKALLEALADNTNPTILAGDFNATPGSESMKLFEAAQWRILDEGGKKTCPSVEPRTEIDFFVTRGLPEASIEHDVIEEKVASDHRPIHAVFTFPPTKQ